MRNANGFGTVYKLTGKRRNPWVAKKFLRWDVDDDNRKTKPVYKVIGYFPKKTEAMKALALENINPTPDAVITFSDVFSLWKEKHYETVTEITARTYENAYGYLSPLHEKGMRQINTFDIERAVEMANPPRTVRRVIKSLLIQMYHYAIRHDICDKDYSQLVELGTDTETRIKRKIFTQEDMDNLPDNVYGDIMLVGIYTGMRPSELCELKRGEVDFETGFLRIAGSKTEAGKNRVVPIHPNILPTLQRNCLKSAKFDATGVFLNQHDSIVKYQRYKEQVYKTDHTPHDTRHTFATYAMQSGMDDYAVKLIMGHTTKDLTKSVYTHATESWLKQQMEKYKICE